MSEILKLVKKFDEYRSKCLNLQASENIMSRDARAALGSGMASRYSHVDHETHENSYGGTSIIEEIEESVKRMASKLYRSKYAEVRPIGGHVALESTLISILKKGDSFLYIDEKDGGYPGYRQDMIPGMFGFTGIPIPYFYDRQEIDFRSYDNIIHTGLYASGSDGIFQGFDISSNLIFDIHCFEILISGGYAELCRGLLKISGIHNTCHI